MSAEQSLQTNLEALGLSAEAIDWLLRIWRAIQTFDDFADGDEVSRDCLYSLIHDTLIGLHTQPFFMRNAHRLLPVMEAAFFKWKAANQAEDGGHADARSFMWRAGFYDLVLIAAVIEGRDTSAALSIYGECLGSYLKEFADA